MDNFGIKMKKIVVVTILGSVFIPSTALAQSNLCRRPNTISLYLAPMVLYLPPQSWLVHVLVFGD